MTTREQNRDGRFQEIDSLRGLAAISVVLFHYTTRYNEVFGHATPAPFSVPWGHYGVNLFFIVSGFVIFMTLNRTFRPFDFVVSRFTRLYPAYWVAVTTTFVIVGWLGLPGREVGLPTGIANLAMFHGLLNFKHVDGVYWTLEVELLFYAWALLAFGTRQLSRIHVAISALLVLRLTYFTFEQLLDVRLSYTIERLLILQYIPWFACGIMIYRLTAKDQFKSTPLDIAVLISSILIIGIVNSFGVGVLAAALSFTVWAAATGYLSFLKHPVLIWFGAISYTLYLLHENIGFAVMRKTQAAGISVAASMLVAGVVSLVLATLISRYIEKPAMNWLRSQYKSNLETQRFTPR